MPFATFAAAVVSILLGAIGQLFLKLGAGRLSGMDRSHGSASIVASLALNWQLILGLAFYALSAMIWVYVLSAAHLSQAYPLVGLSFVAVLVLSAVFLGEPISAMQLLGCAVIFSGIMLIVRG